MSVYGYARVSTSRQANEGESLDVQHRTIAGYAMMHGLELTHVYIEGGVSGSVPLADRAEGASLLAALKPGDVVITAKLDRMFRSASNALDVLESMKAKGIALHMIDLGGDVTGNGISKLVFTILSAVAESERDRIRERVASVKADQRQRGRYLGGKVPFGYIVGAEGTLQEVPEQQAALTTARAMRSSRAKLRVIREALIEQHGVTLCIASVANITESAA